MDKIREFLKSIGFNDKEVAVYLGCLMQGEGTVLEIAKQAGVKRPTAYLILEDLSKRGFVLSMKDKKSIKYSPANPKKIITQLKNNLETANELMPEIQALYRSDEEKPSVSIYEELDGYIYAGDVTREYVMKGKELLIIANPAFFYEVATESSDKWFKVIKNKKCRARLLLYGWNDLVRSYVKRTESSGNPNIKMRVIAETTYPVNTDEAIMEDTVQIFTGGQKFNLLEIHSKNLANTHKEMFERLWSQGVEPDSLK